MQTTEIFDALAESGLDMVEREIVSRDSAEIMLGEDHDAHVHAEEAYLHYMCEYDYYDSSDYDDDFDPFED